LIKIIKMNKIEKVKELIEQDGLKSNSRRRCLIDKRSYLYKVLREEGMTLMKIAELFNRDHASVINGLKKHEQLTKYKDYNYEFNTRLYRQELELTYIAPRSLADDVLRCQNTRELKLIQERLIMGKYF